MHWFPRIQISGTGVAIVSAFGPTLGIDIPYWLRLGAFLVGIAMIVAPFFPYAAHHIKQRPSIGVISILLAVLAGWFGYQRFYPGLRAERSVLPIAISKIGKPSVAPRAWLAEDWKDDDFLLTLDDVFISNTSQTKQVALEIKLIVAGKGKFRMALRGDGQGLGMVVGKNNIAAKQMEKFGLVPPDIIYSPLILAPMQTAHGAIPFVVPAPPAVNEQMTKIKAEFEKTLLEGDLSYTLEIADKVSGHTISIPLPGEYRVQ
jgi:hypothetical protein